MSADFRNRILRSSHSILGGSDSARHGFLNAMPDHARAHAVRHAFVEHIHNPEPPFKMGVSHLFNPARKRLAFRVRRVFPDTQLSSTTCILISCFASIAVDRCAETAGLISQTQTKSFEQNLR
jgi:hypothetical protein